MAFLSRTSDVSLFMSDFVMDFTAGLVSLHIFKTCMDKMHETQVATSS